jgi:lipopolysaccharide cholinephosphotransferase
MAKLCYKRIYKYDSMSQDFKYCYWITPAKFRNGLFDESFFSDTIDIPFEDTVLLGASKIKEYLVYRYGDYMKLPSEEERKAAVHAEIYDTDKKYTEYLK